MLAWVAGTLLVLLTTIHLLAVNIATAGPFVALWCEWRETKTKDALFGKLGRKLVWVSLWLAGIGIVLGFPMAGLLWLLYPESFANSLTTNFRNEWMWAGLPGRAWWGFAELAFYALTMYVYLRTWDLWRAETGGKRYAGRIFHRMLAIVSGTNILYHLPVFWAVITVRSQTPAWQTEDLKFAEMMVSGEVWARVGHGWLAAFAVTGTWMLWEAYKLRRQNPLPAPGPNGEMEFPKDDAHRIATWGGLWAAIPTGMQLIMGPLLLLALPNAGRAALFGVDPLLGLTFVVSLLLSFGLLGQTALAAAGESDEMTIKRCMVLMVLTVFLMVIVRHGARDASVKTQPSPQQQQQVEKSSGLSLRSLPTRLGAISHFRA